VKDIANMMNYQGAGPLEGVRVLDLGNNITAPVSANLLGALGAEVIKLERPDGGDNSRTSPPFVGEHGAHFGAGMPGDMALSFLKRNRYKRSVTCNLKHPDGIGLFRALAAVSDVVVENLRPGALQKLGLEPADMLAANPRLIWCGISGFGKSGKYGNWLAYDGIIQAFTGIVARTGLPELPPVKAGFAVADTLSSLFATLGIMAALSERERTGRGSFVDVAMIDCAAWALWDDPLDVLNSLGRPPRSGNNNQRAAPWNMYTCDDGYVFICALTNEQWDRLTDLIDFPDGKKLRSAAARYAAIEAIDLAIGIWCKERARDDVVRSLQSITVPCGPVRDPVELLSDPALAERGVFRPVRHPDYGEKAEVSEAAIPFRLGDWQPSEERTPPKLGADSTEVYQDLLGLSSVRLHELRESGAI
jgi:crotonobetainyl-CoA:carnitine CoA-transferase CaiB-like acyl-CoA transferase